uniref:Uncharacterized protein n=1 Tax=Rhizophora mucronata TaxID=61149 RepID=A0A2P2NUB3_RHIMU
MLLYLTINLLFLNFDMAVLSYAGFSAHGLVYNRKSCLFHILRYSIEGI